MNKIIRIETLGCRLNQIESEAAARIFLDQQFKVIMSPVSAKSEEDFETCLCIVNTCTVTQKAEQKARRIIRLLLSKYQNSIILVTGCYAQLRSAEINGIDSRVLALGGQIKSRIGNIPDLLNKSLENWNPLEFKKILNDNLINIKINKIGFAEDSFKLSTSSFLAHSRASLKIQDGCNNKCSYCAIHIARGYSVSIDVETAIQRVKEIEKNNIPEIVITTVNIAQYRSNYNGEMYNFTKLLKKLLEVTTFVRFRISSLYPEIIDDEFCEVIKNERIQPHFHISVQSGSNKILKLMNRYYDSKQIVESCNRLRESKANPFIACDIITGFPGETDSDFEETLQLCKKCDFTWVHAFPFSERPGTEAVKLPDKVPQSISGKRAKILNDISVQNKIKYINNFINKELFAVLETSRNPVILNPENKKMIYHAVTENFIHCEIITNDYFEGSNKVKIIITEVLTDHITKGGEIEARAKIVQKF